MAVVFLAAALCALSLLLFIVLRKSDGAFLADLLRLLLLEASLVLTYLGLFTGIEDDSPSMAIARKAAMVGVSGFTEKDVHTILPSELLFAERIEAMRRDRWVFLANGKWTFTALGRFWARFFSSGRRLFAFRDHNDAYE